MESEYRMEWEQTGKANNIASTNCRFNFHRSKYINSWIDNNQKWKNETRSAAVMASRVGV